MSFKLLDLLGEFLAWRTSVAELSSTSVGWESHLTTEVSFIPSWSYFCLCSACFSLFQLHNVVIASYSPAKKTTQVLTLVQSILPFQSIRNKTLRQTVFSCLYARILVLYWKLNHIGQITCYRVFTRFCFNQGRNYSLNCYTRRNHASDSKLIISHPATENIFPLALRYYDACESKLLELCCQHVNFCFKYG